MSSSTISKLAVGGPTSSMVKEGQFKGIDHTELAQRLLATVEATAGVVGRLAAIRLITTYVAILTSGGLKRRNFRIENYSAEAQRVYGIMNPIVTANGWTQNLTHFVQAYPVITAMTSAMKPNNVKVPHLPAFLSNTQGCSLIPAGERFRELLLFGCHVWSARFSMMTNGRFLQDVPAETKLGIINANKPTVEAMQSALTYGMQSFTGAVLSEAERILYFNSLVRREFGTWANFEAEMDALSNDLFGYGPTAESAAGNGQAEVATIDSAEFLPVCMRYAAIRDRFNQLFPGITMEVGVADPNFGDWTQDDMDFLKGQGILTTVNGQCGPTVNLVAGVFPNAAVTAPDPLGNNPFPNNLLQWPPGGAAIDQMINMEFGNRVDGFVLGAPAGVRRAPMIYPLKQHKFLKKLELQAVMVLTFQAEREKMVSNAKVQLELAKSKPAIVSRLVAGQKPAAGLSVDANGDLVADLKAVLESANAAEDAQKVELLARSAKAELDAHDAKEDWVANHPNAAPRFLAFFNQ